MIEQFVEKPSHEIAKKYVSEGGYFWNSGMFVFRADVILSAFQILCATNPKCLPRQLRAIRRRDGLFMRLGREDFESSPSDSIDYAVMEKAEHVMMVPLDAGWDDIGSWEAYWGASQKDEAQKRVAWGCDQQGYKEFADHFRSGFGRDAGHRRSCDRQHSRRCVGSPKR